MSPSPAASPRARERWLTGLLALAALVILVSFFYRTSANKHLDTAFLFEGTASILVGGKPYSNVVTSWAQGYRFLELPAQEVCVSALRFVTAMPYNVLSNHAYFALYPIAALAALAGVEFTFALLHAAAHLALPLLAYGFLRRRGLGVAACIAFAALVVAYPGWSLSASGDYYLDRLAMPGLLLLLYLLQGHVDAGGGSRSPVAVLAVALAAALFTERAAIMVIGTLAYFLVFYPQLRRDRPLSRGLAVLALLLGVYLAAYFGFVFEGIAGGGQLTRNAVVTAAALWQRLQSPGMAAFVATNTLFLGWLALLAGWRSALLVLGAMVPNMLISMGGAELTGWSTHYHTMYIPFLVYAASLGYARLLVWTAGRERITAALLLLGTAMSIRCFDPFTAHWQLANDAPSSRLGAVGAAWRYFLTPSQSGDRATAGWARTLRDVVPKGASVSAIEGAMPVLYAGRTLSMYPVGLDSADYLVVVGEARDGAITSMSGAVSYLGPEIAEQLNTCLAERAVRQGFVLERAVPAIGVLVLRRLQRPPV